MAEPVQLQGRDVSGREHYGDGLDITRIRRSSHVAPLELAALAKAGLASREKTGPNARDAVYWSWAGERIDMTSVQHLDFDAPSETDMALADLAAAGAKIEWVTNAFRTVTGVARPAIIEWRQNGPLKYFNIQLWSGAAADDVLKAVLEANAHIKHPMISEFYKRKPNVAYCLG